MKTWCRLAAPLFATAQLSTTVLAQSNPGWIIEVVGGPVSPSNPSVQVKVSAFFTPVTSSFAFGAGRFDVVSTDANGQFGNLTVGAGLVQSCTQGSQLGVSNANGGVTDVWIHQLNVLGCQAVPTNPIEIWTATWTTSDFSPRQVQVSTLTTGYFQLFSHHGTPFPDIFFEPKDVIPGSAVIQVIPAPSGALALLLTGAALATRRRI